MVSSSEAPATATTLDVLAFPFCQFWCCISIQIVYKQSHYEVSIFVIIHRIRNKKGVTFQKIEVREDFGENHGRQLAMSILFKEMILSDKRKVINKRFADLVI